MEYKLNGNSSTSLDLFLAYTQQITLTVFTLECVIKVGGAANSPHALGSERISFSGRRTREQAAFFLHRSVRRLFQHVSCFALRARVVFN